MCTGIYHRYGRVRARVSPRHVVVYRTPHRAATLRGWVRVLNRDPYVWVDTECVAAVALQQKQQQHCPELAAFWETAHRARWILEEAINKKFVLWWKHCPCLKSQLTCNPIREISAMAIDDESSSVRSAEEYSASNDRRMSILKSFAACAFFYGAFVTWSNKGVAIVDAGRASHRKLTMMGDSIPEYMEGLMKDLRERQKLFEETPPEEVKYWFEYTGPLQVRYASYALQTFKNPVQLPSQKLTYFVPFRPSSRNISIAFPGLVVRQIILKGETTPVSHPVVLRTCLLEVKSIPSFSGPPPTWATMTSPAT